MMFLLKQFTPLTACHALFSPVSRETISFFILISASCDHYRVKPSKIGPKLQFSKKSGAREQMYEPKIGTKKIQPGRDHAASRLEFINSATF